MRLLSVVVALSLGAGCSALSSLDDGGVDGGSSLTQDAGTVRDGGGGTFDAGTPDAGTTSHTVLRVVYPTARALFVRGSLPPLDWNVGVPMQRVDANTWSVTLDGVAPGAALEWKPLLDDSVWSKGPNYRAVGGGSSEVVPHFLRDVGEWSIRWPSFASTLLGNSRGVYVYLPPTYLENSAARFPVVYLHDGQNLFDPLAAFGGVTWRVPETMDQAAGDGRFREAIVVGPENGGAARIDEYTPTVDTSVGGGGRGDLYLRMLKEELKPRVDAELRTLTGPADTALMGSSLGGLISAYAGVQHSTTFGLIGAMSPSVWWDNRVLLSKVAMTGSQRPLRVYVDSGDSGPSNDGMTDTLDLVSAYRTLGYVEGSTLHSVVQQGATHTESAWASRLPGALEFLLGPGR